MTKKQGMKKLALQRETVRSLDRVELAKVAAGMMNNTHSCNGGCTGTGTTGTGTGGSDSYGFDCYTRNFCW